MTEINNRERIIRMEEQIKTVKRDVEVIDKRTREIKGFLFSEGKDGLIEKLEDYFATKTEVKNVKDSLRSTQRILFFVGGAIATWLISFALRRLFFII